MNFPGKNSSHFLNIPIIYHRTKNQKKLNIHSQEKCWTDRWTDRQTDDGQTDNWQTHKQQWFYRILCRTRVQNLVLLYENNPWMKDFNMTSLEIWQYSKKKILKTLNIYFGLLEPYIIETMFFTVYYYWKKIKKKLGRLAKSSRFLRTSEDF